MNNHPHKIRFFRGLLLALSLLVACGGKAPPHEPLGLSALLMEENGRVVLVLRNVSGMELYLCKRNFYLPLDYIDIRHYPDSTVLPFDKVFGKKPCIMKRRDVTVSDFVSLPPDKEIKLPVDLRCVQKKYVGNDTVFLAVKFMNIDPFICSRVEVKKYRPEIQEYCELFHYVPKKDLHYWEGEVRTPLYPYTFAKKDSL